MKDKNKKKYPEDEILEQEENNQDEIPLSSEEDNTQVEASETEDWQEKYNALNDQNLRLMAEFDNYRKRTLKERIDFIKTANEKLLVDMLPLIDDFERAIQAMNETDDINAVKEGVELIYSKFTHFLQQNGVKPIPSENENFDTEYHEAVTLFPAPSEEMKGKIIDCISKGYTLNDKVIRFSKVVVGE